MLFLCSDSLLLIHGFSPCLSNPECSAFSPMFQGLLSPTSPISGDFRSILIIGGVVLRVVFIPGMSCIFKTAISRGLVPYSCRIPGLVPLFALRERNRDWSLILSYSGHLPLSGSSSVSRGVQKLRVKRSIPLLLIFIRCSCLAFPLNSLKEQGRNTGYHNPIEHFAWIS